MDIPCRNPIAIPVDSRPPKMNRHLINLPLGLILNRVLKHTCQIHKLLLKLASNRQLDLLSIYDVNSYIFRPVHADSFQVEAIADKAKVQPPLVLTNTRKLIPSMAILACQEIIYNAPYCPGEPEAGVSF